MAPQPPDIRPQAYRHQLRLGRHTPERTRATPLLPVHPRCHLESRRQHQNQTGGALHTRTIPRPTPTFVERPLRVPAHPPLAPTETSALGPTSTSAPVMQTQSAATASLSQVKYPTINTPPPPQLVSCRHATSLFPALTTLACTSALSPPPPCNSSSADHCLTLS